MSIACITISFGGFAWGRPESQLNKARYYGPQLGRFTSEAPIDLAGDFIQYAYASGNPISRVDPLGLWSIGLEKY